MAHFVVLGAGAVGSTLGAYLARAGHDVLLVARPAHAEAIRKQGHLRVSTYAENFPVRLRAETVPPSDAPADTVLFLTVQSPDVTPAMAGSAALARRFPVVTWQNGIRAEEAAAPFAPRLYGGVVRFTSTLLEPGEVRLRAPGQLILGRHPEGTDRFTADLSAELRRAGFTAAESPDIRRDKALKLLVNLVSGPAVLYRRTGADPALACLQVALLEEGDAVFRAAGVIAEPASGLGEPLPAMIRRFRAGGSAPDGRPVYNSTWQNLHYRRPRLENSFYHGEVIELGRRFGVPTPVNERVLSVLEEACRRRLGPEPYDRGTFIARFADVVDMSGAEEAPPPDPGAPSLEI